MPKRMLILRGISGHFDGRDWPCGALYEEPALEYARRRGYVGKVLDASGEPGPDSDQTDECLREIRNGGDVAALYGFSGGGYNVRHVLRKLAPHERKPIKLVVVLGAPNNSPELYRPTRYTNGSWELVYRTDPDAGHMAGPKVLLAELGPKTGTA